MRTTLCALLTSLVLAPVPDLLPPDTKAVPTTTRLDLGPLDGKVCLSYQVAAGDTLGAIAKTWLGDAARHPEILAMNPGVVAERLQPGQSLWLPAKDPTATAAPCLFVQVQREPRPRPIDATLVLPPTRSPALTFHLVPPTQLAGYLAAAQERTLPAFVKANDLRPVAATTVSRYVRASTPIARIAACITFRTAKDGALEATTTAQYFDAAGKQLEVDAKGEVRSTPTRQGELLLLLLLAGSGGWWLWQRARRPQLAPVGG